MGRLYEYRILVPDRDVEAETSTAPKMTPEALAMINLLHKLMREELMRNCQAVTGVYWSSTRRIIYAADKIRRAVFHGFTVANALPDAADHFKVNTGPWITVICVY